MQNILLLWIGLAVYLALFHNILHAKTKKSVWHFLLALLIVVAWSAYDCLAEFPAPETFCILVLIPLIMQEKWYFSLCWTIIFTLCINIASNVSCYFYYFITKCSPDTDMQPYLLLSVLVSIFLVYISFRIRQKQILSRSAIQQITWKGYALIGFVTLTDFILSSLSSLLIDGDPLGKYLSHILLTAIFILILMSTLLLFLYFRLQHYHILLQQNNMIQQDLLDLETQHYRDLQRKTLDLRAFRHDYNYQLFL